MDAEKKVNSYWDMLPTELHVVILKIHRQETMLFHTRDEDGLWVAAH